MDSEKMPLPLQERMKALAAFLPRLERPDFKAGQWVNPPPEKPGVITMGYYDLSEPAKAFVQMAYEARWVLPDFDWPTWAQTPEAAELRDNPDALAQATVKQLAQLLTVIIRQDRFCEGSLAAAFETGLVTAICRRAAHLEPDHAAGEI